MTDNVKFPKDLMLANLNVNTMNNNILSPPPTTTHQSSSIRFIQDSGKDKDQHNDNLKLQSKIFEWLRFPLIIGVVFIHTAGYISALNPNVSSNNSSMFYWISNLFSNVIGRISVPLFFFISGYLFFFGLKKFKWAEYIYKLKRRTKTLVIPYIFWNSIFVVLILAVGSLSSSIIENKITGIGFQNIIDWYFGKSNGLENKMTYPACYPFWFIRDLICCVIISPVIYYIVSKSYMSVIFLGLLWFLGYEIPIVGYRGFSMSALFFFSLGSWMSVNKRTIIVNKKSLKMLGVLYPLMMILDLITRPYSMHPYIHNLGIISGIIFVFMFATWLIDKRELKPVPVLTSASFFIFAIHDPFLLRRLHHIIARIIQPTTDVNMCINYFGSVIVVVLLAISIYLILKKLNPQFLSIITGGR